MGNPEPNLADLLPLIAESQLPATRKRDMASAVRTIARALGAAPEQVPLDLKLLRPRLDNISAESIGISKSRWNNVRALFGRALELTTPLMPSAQKIPMSPDWQALIAPLPTQYRHCLGAMLRFLSARGVGPSKVTLPDLEAFRIAITENRLRAKPEKTWDHLAWCWNRLAKMVEDWPQVFIPREDKRVIYTQPWADFPANFKADVDAYIKVLSGEFLDEEGPVRPLRPVSLAEREYLLRSAASALVAAGHPIEQVRSIADIARLEPIKLILEQVLNRGEGEHKMGALHMAKMLRAAAKYWVKVDDAGLAKISRIVARLGPQPSGLTPKNRERLMPFNDPEVVQRFLAMPQRMADDIRQRSRKTVVDAVNAQITVAIAILQAVPIRIRNLVSLDLERHLAVHGNRVFVVLPAEEIKNAQPLQLELPGEVADLISWYCVEYRDLLVTTPTSALFPNRNGEPKKRKHLGTQITKRVQKYLGLPVNPHLFRHLAAKLYLDAHPGEYGLIQRLLGHKSVSTTMAAYTGAETISATRHYQNHVEKLRSESAAPKRRRRQP